MLSKLTSILNINACIGFTVGPVICSLFFLLDHPFLGLLAAGAVSGTIIASILHRGFYTPLVASAFAFASLIGGYFILTSIRLLYLTEGNASIEDAVLGFGFLFLFGFALIGVLGAISISPRWPARALILGAKSFVKGGVIGIVLIGPLGLLGKLPLIIMCIGLTIANAVGGGILALKIEKQTDGDQYRRELSLNSN